MIFKVAFYSGSCLLYGLGVLCFAMDHCLMITFCLFWFWYEFYQATWHVLAATILQTILARCMR
jgi:hypothetical protein